MHTKKRNKMCRQTKIIQGNVVKSNKVKVPNLEIQQKNNEK
jgi:hypothetical protein